MNKRAIWLTIGLMGIALIGILALQFYWIRWSVQLNENRFDDNVISALKRVSDMLVSEKENVDRYTLDKILIDKLSGEHPIMQIMNDVDNLLVNGGNLNDSIFKKQDKHAMEAWEKNRIILEMYDRHVRINPIEFAQRINPNKLDELLKHELNELHIDLEYKYGVYDNATMTYVIVNGNYVVNLGEGKASDSEMDLNTSKNELSYVVDLFLSFKSSPGFLKVIFPTKTKWLWRSVLPLIILSLILTGIILGCFYYVVTVIFRQKKLSEIKNDFVNNMTHEFKTPIATINLASDSILSPKVLADQSRIQRFIGIIKEENKRMLSQVEKVLQMALLDKQDFQLNIKSVDIHEIIQKAVENIDLQVSQRNGTIIKSLNAKKSVLTADQTHLTNIIYNLLDNANKYSAETPQIRISTKDVHHGIEIQVIDNGIGMSKDNQKMVFEKFFRVPTGNLHNVKGFGLGLSYVKAMAEAHKGWIKLDSELNKGSTFTLFLPN